MIALLHLFASVLVTGPVVAAGYLAEIAVQSPNAGRTVEMLGAAPPEVLAGQHVGREFRVDVARPGVPPASLHVFVKEPRHQDLTIERKADGRTFAGFGFADRPGAAPPPKGVVVVLHGLRGGKERRFESTVSDLFTTAGYRVIQPDLRGHGRSTGDRLGYGVFEAGDLSAVLDDAEGRGLLAGADGRRLPVGAFGVSMGGAVAVQWAARDARVGAVVAVSPFASMRAAVGDFGRAVMGRGAWVLTWQLGPVVERAGRLAGFDPADADAVSAARQAAARGVPILVIHGSDDAHVPAWHGRAIAQAAGRSGELVVLEGENHWSPWVYRLETIHERGVGWFDDHLRRE